MDTIIAPKTYICTKKFVYSLLLLLLLLLVVVVVVVVVVEASRFLSKNLKIKIYRTIILPVALYGCETWSLTLTKERRL